MSAKRPFRVVFADERHGPLGAERAYRSGWKPSSYTTFESALVRAGALHAVSGAIAVRILDSRTDEVLALVSSGVLRLRPMAPPQRSGGGSR